MRWVYAVLAAYVIGFLVFPPRALLVIDEHSYVAQAMAFADFRLNLPNADPLVPANPLRVASNYPPGTSLLQAPLVAVAGWRGAAALSMLALVLATLVTARWLRESGRDPRFALLVCAFAGSLFFGRLAMSDVPSAAWCALAAWTLFRARDRRGAFTAGLVAGVGLLLRETNAVLIAPLLIGAIARASCDRRFLSLGVAAGVALRLGASYALFGDALHVRDSGFGFSPGSFATNLPVYAALLLVLFPLGAALPVLYRGPRRAELAASVALYVGIFLFYDYGGVRENGLARGLLLTSRFMVPLLPLLAFMAAEAWPRLVARRYAAHRALAERAIVIVLVCVAAGAAAIHPLMRRLERAPLAVARALHEVTRERVPVITNHHVTLKYFSPVYGPRRLILRSAITPADVPALRARYGPMTLALLDRVDTELFRSDAAGNADFVAALRQRCELRPVRDARLADMRLHAYELPACAP